MLSYTSLGLISVAGVCLYLVRRYFTGAISANVVKMAGKTVLITGANCGIGKATAHIMAQRQARVIMACRDLRKGEEAAMDVASATGCDLTKLVVKQLDLASLQSVARFCEDIVKTEARLDVLICNAGVAFIPELQHTEDGFEMQMGTNHLGHVALTERLVPLLKSSSPSRVVIVSSVLYKGGSFEEDNLNFEKTPYNPSKGYANSKLANILYGSELSRRLGGTGVFVYSVSPGIVKTELGRHRPLSLPLKIILSPFMALFLKTPYQGAQTSVYCATELNLENESASGKFYRDCKETALVSGHQAENEELARKLYDLSLAKVGL